MEHNAFFKKEEKKIPVEEINDRFDQARLERQYADLTNKAIRLMINPKFIEDSKRFEDDHHWMWKNYDTLKQFYNNEWVLIYDKKIVDHSDDYWVIMAVLRDAFPEKRGNMVLGFITDKPRYRM